MENINAAIQLLQQAADYLYQLNKYDSPSEKYLDDLYLLSRVQLRLYQRLVNEFHSEFGA